MLLNVEHVRLSASGKSYMVRCTNGDKYVAALSCKGIEQAGGRQIEAVIGNWTAPDGRLIITIDAFTFTGESAPARSSNASPNAAPTRNGADRWWLNFVSNTVAHAIQAGLIKEVSEIAQWARGAKLAIWSADTVGPDEVPF